MKASTILLALKKYMCQICSILYTQIQIHVDTVKERKIHKLNKMALK